MTAEDEKRFRLIIREELQAAGLTSSGAPPLASPITTQQQTELLVAGANRKLQEKLARKAAKLANSN